MLTIQLGHICVKYSPIKTYKCVDGVENSHTPQSSTGFFIGLVLIDSYEVNDSNYIHSEKIL